MITEVEESDDLPGKNEENQRLNPDESVDKQILIPFTSISLGFLAIVYMIILKTNNAKYRYQSYMHD
jgi:hypothetical protein